MDLLRHVRGARNTRVPAAQELRHRTYEGNVRGDAVNDIDRKGQTRAEKSASKIGCARSKSYFVYITEIDSVKKALMSVVSYFHGKRREWAGDGGMSAS
jgi:hypothetical protein